MPTNPQIGRETTYVLTVGLLDALADHVGDFTPGGSVRLWEAQAAIVVNCEQAMRFYSRFDVTGEIIIEPMQVDLDLEQDFRSDLFPVVLVAYDDHRVCATGAEFPITDELLAERERFRAPLVDFWC